MLTVCADKVRLLYDRDLPTARLVARSKEDLDPPLVTPSVHIMDWAMFMREYRIKRSAICAQ
jgi:hypothetical protein